MQATHDDKLFPKFRRWQQDFQNESLTLWDYVTAQADIERICYAAIRRMVLAGDHLLDESHFADGVRQVMLRRQAQSRVRSSRRSDDASIPEV